MLAVHWRLPIRNRGKESKIQMKTNYKNTTTKAPKCRGQQSSKKGSKPGQKPRSDRKRNGIPSGDTDRPAEDVTSLQPGSVSLPKQPPYTSDGSARPFLSGEDQNGKCPPITPDAIEKEHGPLVEVNDERIRFNQPAIAAKFVAEYRIVFDPTINGFRNYDPETGVWKGLDPAAVVKLLAAFLKRIADDRDLPGILPLRTNGLLNAILSIARGMAKMGQPKNDELRILVSNGVIRFVDGKAHLDSFSADDWAIHGCAIAYDENAKCPRFLNDLLKPALPDPDDLDLLQRWLGGVVLGRNDAQRFMLLHGGGQSGKSTVITIVEGIIGGEAVAHLRTSHLNGRFETQFFQRKTLLAAKDVSSDALLKSGAKTIKSLTGGDLIESEKKFGGKTKLFGGFNLVVTSNHRTLLALDDDESAWLRRLLVLEFLTTPNLVKITGLAGQLLAEEGAGILAWAVEGAEKLIEELQGGDFVLSAKQKERIQNLVLESRSIQEFIQKGVITEAKADLTGEELHDAYRQFCKARGWMPRSMKSFKIEIGELMVNIHDSHRRNDIARNGQTLRGFKGVALVRAATPATSRKSTAGDQPELPLEVPPSTPRPPAARKTHAVKSKATKS
jgi:P4 family phage/plasmid primase-like protien